MTTSGCLLSPSSRSDQLVAVNAASRLAPPSIDGMLSIKTIGSDASAMAGWFGGTALYYAPPALSANVQLEMVAASATIPSAGMP